MLAIVIGLLEGAGVVNAYPVPFHTQLGQLIAFVAVPQPSRDRPLRTLRG